MVPCEGNENHGNSAIAVVKHPGLSKVVPHCALHLLPRYGLAQSIFDLHQWICWDQGRLLRLMISTCSVHLSVVSRPQKAKAPSNPLLANHSAAQPFQPRQVIKLNCRRNILCDNLQNVLGFDVIKASKLVEWQFRKCVHTAINLEAQI